MSPVHHTPALSPSRLNLYRECPALYKRRYIDLITDPPTIDMEYGQALHKGLEAHFLGEDPQLAFLRELKARCSTLISAGAEPADWLVPQGLRLLEETIRLGFKGQPERSFIYAYAGFRIPFRGIIDLWDQRGHLIVDWKTTRHQWSEKTAENYALQRAIYCQAYLSERHVPPVFWFVALGAYPGGIVQVLPSTPTEQEQADSFEQIYDLYLGIEAEVWDCTCRNKQHQGAA